MARSKGRRKLKPTYAIVGDGFTEKIYFDDLKRVEGLKNVNIKPELPKSAGSYDAVLRKVNELLDDDYDKVYAIIDLDEIITSNNLNKFQNDLKPLKNDIKKGKLILIICNPCFEIWFLLHFNYSTKQFRRCSGVSKELRKEKDLKDYSKSKDYLNKINIYELLRPRLLNKAIPNSEKLCASQGTATGKRYPKCQVHKIIKDLGIK